MEQPSTRVQESLTAEPQIWNFSTGEGSTPAQREGEKPLLALFALNEALCREPRFWEQVAAVAGDFGLASKLARRYGNGPRRAGVIAHRLQTAAARWPDQDAAARALYTASYYTDTEPQRGRGTYRYRPEFHDLLHAGATCIAHRGAGTCFVCGGVLVGGAVGQGRRARRDYCSSHEPSTSQERVDAAALEHAITDVFRHAARAVAALPLPPRSCPTRERAA